MATGNITKTTVDAFVPEIWSTLVQHARNTNLHFGNLVDRRYEKEIKGRGDTIRIPIFGAGTVKTKVDGTPIVLTTQTETVATIVIDKDKYTAINIEDLAEIQTDISLVSEYAVSQGVALANQIDVDLALLLNDTTVTQNVGTVTSGAYVDITDNTLLAARRILNEANVPMTDRYIVISPQQEEAMLKIDKFIDADKVTSANLPVPTGSLGKIYGMPVYVSNNLADVAIVSSVSSASPVVYPHKACGMFHKEAFAFASQVGITAEASRDHNNFADILTFRTIYGTAVLRADHAVQMRTTTEA